MCLLPSIMSQQITEDPMHRCRLACILRTLTLLPVAIGSCSPPVRHQNASHPNYGEAEYRSDLSQCRRENSTIVMSSGYDEKGEVQVDAGKVETCMAARGWRPT
jgi:hypothetical protein